MSTGTPLPPLWWLRGGKSCFIWGRCFWPSVRWRACISRDSFKAIKRSGAARSSRANLRYRLCPRSLWSKSSGIRPARSWTGNEIDVGRLLSPQGDKAAAWIHLFAITVLLIIVIPRAALAAWQWRNIKRRRSDIGLRLDPYYGEVIEAPVRALIEKEVAERGETVLRGCRGLRRPKAL